MAQVLSFCVSQLTSLLEAVRSVLAMCWCLCTGLPGGARGAVCSQAEIRNRSCTRRAALGGRCQRLCSPSLETKAVSNLVVERLRQSNLCRLLLLLFRGPSCDVLYEHQFICSLEERLLTETWWQVGFIAGNRMRLRNSNLSIFRTSLRGRLTFYSDITWTCHIRLGCLLLRVSSTPAWQMIFLAVGDL